MKKTLSMLLAIVMVISLIPISAFAADTNGQFTIAFETDFTNEMAVGDAFTVTGMLSNNTEAFGAMALALKWNESVVKFTGFKMNGRAMDSEVFNSSQGYTAPILNQDEGIITATDTLGYDLNGKLFVANFEIIAESGELGIGLKTDSRSDYMIRNVEGTEDVDAILDYSAIEGLYVGGNQGGGEDDSGSTTEAPTYTASVTTNAENNTVVNGQEIIVKVNVGTSDFASANVVMSYDSTKLQYNGFTSAATDAGDGDQAAEIASGSGTLTITDFGGTITKGEGVYQVTFKAIDGGQTQVTLESAAFSTQAYAETDNLVNATIDPKTQTVNINHKITVNGTDVGSAAADGTGSYEFTISDYDPLYDYTVSVTMGTEQVTPESLGNGKYKVDPIRDDLTITYTKGNRNAFGVTWAGDYADLEEQYKSITSVAVGESLTIALPDGAEATADQAGYSYSAVIKIGETEHKQMASGESYTIPSDAINDDITITVTKTTTPALGYNYVTVTIPADSGVEIDGVTGTSTTVKEGDPVTLKLTAADADLYNYSVKMGDQEILNNTTTSVIINPTNDVTITVTKALKTDSATATLYLELNGKDMYLLKIGGTEQVNGKVYTYTENGKTRDMFWSAKYNAYCTLIVVDADTTPVLTVGAEGSIAGNFGLKDGTAEEVDYTMDVNKSGTKDINDAQLVWNMYSNKYQGVTENVTIEKFLRADVNDTVGVDSTDAQAIIG